MSNSPRVTPVTVPAPKKRKGLLLDRHRWDHTPHVIAALVEDLPGPGRSPFRLDPDPSVGAGPNSLDGVLPLRKPASGDSGGGRDAVALAPFQFRRVAVQLYGAQGVPGVRRLVDGEGGGIGLPDVPGRIHGPLDSRHLRNHELHGNPAIPRTYLSRVRHPGIRRDRRVRNTRQRVEPRARGVLDDAVEAREPEVQMASGIDPEPPRQEVRPIQLQRVRGKHGSEGVEDG